MAIQHRPGAAVQVLSGDLVQNTGELHLSCISVNAAYNAAKETVILAAGGVLGITITLPLAAANYGKVYVVKKVDAGAGAVIVSRSGADLIDGAASVGIITQYHSRTLVSDGVSTWHLVGVYP
jgi:hypothetical protein